MQRYSNTQLTLHKCYKFRDDFDLGFILSYDKFNKLRVIRFVHETTVVSNLASTMIR